MLWGWRGPVERKARDGFQRPDGYDHFVAEPVASLIAILRETRSLLARPGADSVYSGWRTQAEALKEIDGLITELEEGRLPRWRDLWVLYCGTGPVQDWSMDNGWGDYFMDLSSRFDDALAGVYPESRGH